MVGIDTLIDDTKPKSQWQRSDFQRGFKNSDETWKMKWNKVLWGVVVVVMGTLKMPPWPLSPGPSLAKVTGVAGVTGIDFGRVSLSAHWPSPAKPRAPETASSLGTIHSFPSMKLSCQIYHFFLSFSVKHHVWEEATTYQVFPVWLTFTSLRLVLN